MNRALIDQYEQGSGLLRQALAELSRDSLMAAPPGGGWTLQRIAVHLLDSDLVGADRMKRVIAEDNPPLINYDESRFAERLHYEVQPIDEVLSLFELNRRHTARILRMLPDAAFERTGNHSQRGVVSLAQLLQGYIDHLEHHLRYIREKRAALGWPASK